MIIKPISAGLGCSLPDIYFLTSELKRDFYTRHKTIRHLYKRNLDVSYFISCLSNLIEALKHQIK